MNVEITPRRQPKTLAKAIRREFVKIPDETEGLTGLATIWIGISYF